MSLFCYCSPAWFTYSRLSQTSYPVTASDEIPLRLVMTCENRVAIDLFAVSHAIDVRLLKVLVFGENAAAVTPPFNIVDRKSYHITEWVAKAQWDIDGHSRQLPLNHEHPSPRWRINMNGKLLREPRAEISPSLAQPGIAHMVRGFSGLLRPLADPCH